ncbi:CoA transferase subunit A [Streptomyces sp. NPDC058441]|uniref:CoA transferase subunit A n=1 Tax=Streptomyces sp. NPDC058441 TaxID=3346502 RepID=UPI0036562525
MTLLSAAGPDTVGAREELERRARPRVDKVVSARDAIGEHVADGDVLAVGGTNHARTPMALLIEVLRQGRCGLSLARPLTCFEAELFIATGMADRLITSWVGIGHGWGLAKVLREYAESGRVVYEEWSHLGLGLRYKAGGMGIPFLPSYSMMGSDIGHRLNVEEVTCPYTGQSLNAVPSLNPDVALIHVQRCDVYGNAQIDGYELMDTDIARAARRVVISTEEIVSTEVIQRDPSRTVIPAFAVDAVVHQPMGAYPHECYGRYLADEDAFRDYAERIRAQGAAGAREYVMSLVKHPHHDGFIGSVPSERLDNLVLGAKGMMPR